MKKPATYSIDGKKETTSTTGTLHRTANSFKDAIRKGTEMQKKGYTVTIGTYNQQKKVYEVKQP